MSLKVNIFLDKSALWPLEAAGSAELVLEELDVVDGLDDDLQLGQVTGVLEIPGQQRLQPLYVSLADVGGVKVLHLAHHHHVHDVVADARSCVQVECKLANDNVGSEADTLYLRRGPS